jgi:SAM-dependent methyltransferase
MTARDKLLDRRWFHSIDLGDGDVTPGRFSRNVPPNYTLFGFFDLVTQIDLSQARCYDLGTMDGLGAFVLKGLGAPHVVACDLGPRPSFRFARQRLGLEVDYVTPAMAQDLPAMVGTDKADFLLMAGVLYHVFDPLTVLLACRQALRREGLLVVETHHLPNESAPVMRLNPADVPRPRVDLPHTYWLPSKSAVHTMLRLAGFEVVTSITINTRLTVLARAKRPREISGREPLLKLVQDRNRNPHYREAYDFDAMQRDTSEPSPIRYQGPRGDRFLYRSLFEPQVPFQPKWQPDSSLSRWRDHGRNALCHTRSQWADAQRRWAGRHAGE